MAHIQTAKVRSFQDRRTVLGHQKELRLNAAMAATVSAKAIEAHARITAVSPDGYDSAARDRSFPTVAMHYYPCDDWPIVRHNVCSTGWQVYSTRFKAGRHCSFKMELKLG